MFGLYSVSSPEEYYRQLMNTMSDFLNRVPQYHLASYLGHTTRIIEPNQEALASWIIIARIDNKKNLLRFLNNRNRFSNFPR